MRYLSFCVIIFLTLFDHTFGLKWSNSRGPITHRRASWRYKKPVVLSKKVYSWNKPSYSSKSTSYSVGNNAAPAKTYYRRVYYRSYRGRPSSRKNYPSWKPNDNRPSVDLSNKDKKNSTQGKPLITSVKSNYPSSPKTQSFIDRSKLTIAEKITIVQYHNECRGKVSPSAANMKSMAWNAELANLAQRYAYLCRGDHNQRRHSQQRTFKLVGENIYHTWSWRTKDGVRTTDPLNVTRAMQLWWEEKKDFNYYIPEKCLVTVCGHYTQMVRDVSYAVGCGTHFCSSVTFDDETFQNVHILVCNYGEGYNNNAEPYIRGRACSKCDPEFRKCVGGLCTN